ncbi:acyl-CoA dehydrogenase [Sphingobacterium sp. ML3W]|uniref:acyl-CoA dehydrogenase family protein n=1 Tax=Sphingobacterium TaxID=28453 RepID=UPI0004F837E2|nr:MULTISPECIES: acyl-CoA dehydrogenase family protein [Sphingobacterium]AIM38042.1 acyl-CoA dehydrogenase [Sphingobacterium sp. ML3W]MDH5825888.1 acyl-CoA/acyl-ACP dehydrogenase [Sphingobacterium faecium]
MLNLLEESTMTQDFNVFISAFKERLSNLFNSEYDYNNLSLSRDLPPDFLSKIMDMTPLSVAIPESHGGRGVHVKECLGVLAAASYESLSLSLIFGINIALFLEPLAKYGNASVQDKVFKRFLEHQAMGGLMITEPAYGSDALNMRTSYEQQGDKYHIQGQKHWQGLTGAADYWLVTARKRNENGELTRDIDFFLTEDAVAAQKIEVERRYNSLGLYAIPYGINNIDIQVPTENRLNPESTGIKLMLDTLHRSRLQFPGMGMGFIKRMLDEAMQHCHDRRVTGIRLNEMDSVKFQLSRLQAAFTICSAMCSYSSSMSGIGNDLSGHGVDANSVKAFVTDLMQEASQICLQLSGANGYRLDHVAGRGVVDSRPFQIFEGSNEMLYTQIAEAIAKLMRKSKESNFLAYLKQYKATELAAPFFSELLNFNFPDQPKQRDMMTLGRIIARVVCFQYVLLINNAGFNDEMTEITRQHIKMDIAMFIGQLNSTNHADPLMDYSDNTDWMNFTSF